MSDIVVPASAARVTAENFQFQTEGQEQAYNSIMRWVESMADKNIDFDNRDYKFAKNPIPAGLNRLMEFDNIDAYYVLEGVAGSGKTTILAKLIVDLSAKGYTIAVGAPTNKAVGVIEQKVREFAGARIVAATFKSVHSHVGLGMVESEDGTLKVYNSGRSTVSEYDILIVDEGSMVDFAHQLTGIVEGRGNCIVLFVGDPYQVEPVADEGRSSVFKFPQKSVMNEVVRQARGNPIIEASIKLRALTDSGYRVELSDLRSWLPEENFVSRRKMERMLLAYQRDGRDARAIAFRNRNVISINENIHFDLYPNCGKVMFCEGERVIVQTASKGIDLDTGSKSIDLVTSEELIVMNVEEEKHPQYPNINCWQLVLQGALSPKLILVYTPKLQNAYNNERSRLFDEARQYKAQGGEAYKRALAAAWSFAKAFTEIRHTYASTVHKCQGSTYDYSLLDFGDLAGIPTVSNMNAGVYVALTRPRITAFIGY